MARGMVGAMDEIIADIIKRADADIAAGRYVTVRTEADSEALHEAAMQRLRDKLIAPTTRKADTPRCI